MILRAIRIDGFGVHRDFKLEDLSSGLNVVHGDNEAGKSTLLLFVRAILFGFDKREAMQRTVPLSGGRHGGSLVLESSDGRRVRIARTFREGGKLAGELTAEDERTGDPIDPDAALKRALGSCTRLLFENVFAIGLDDLAKNGTLSAEGLRDHIYGAGMTGRGISLPKVLTDLRKRGHELLPKAGRGGRVSKLLDEIAKHASEARGLSERPEEHRVCVEEAARLRQRLATLDAEIPAKRAEHRRAERLARGAEPWALLSALPATGEKPAFPAGGRERLKQAQEALEQAKRRRTSAVDRRDDLARRIKRAAFDGKLVELAPEIDAFFSEAERRIGNDAPGAALVKAQAATAKARKLKDELGAGWDDARLAGFDASPASERELILHVDRGAEAERVVREARRDADAASEAEAREREDIARLEAEIERIGDAEEKATRLEKRITEFEKSLDEERAAEILWQDVQRRAAASGAAPEAALSGTRQTRTLYGSAAALGAFAVGALVLDAIAVASIAIAGVVALVLVAVLRTPAAAPQSGPGGRETEEARMRWERARAARRDKSILAFERNDATIADAHAARAEAGRLRALAARRVEAERVIAEKKEDLARAARIAVEKRRVADEAQADWKKAKHALEEWLSAHGFPATMPYESARGTLLAVREAQAAFRELEEAQAEVQRLETAAREFAERVEALGQRVGRPGIGKGALATVHVALAALRDDSQRARRAKDERERDKDELEKAEVEAKAAANELEGAQKALDALLAEAGAADVDAFWARAKAAESHEETEKARLGLEGKLRAALGEDAESPEVRDTLRKKTAAELAREAAEIERAVATLERERDEALQALARVEEKQKELEKDDRLAEARLHEESKRAELASAADEWRVLAACEWLLDRARRKYEEEHQPVILRSAGALLETFTRGRWVAVRALAGAEEGDVVRAVRWDGEAVSPAALSRATLDQLYLALRLALAADFPDPGVRIPMVLDDVLVNFSRTRREAAAEAIASVARRVQVLAFTCHAELRDAFAHADPTAKRIELLDPALPPVRKPQLAEG